MLAIFELSLSIRKIQPIFIFSFTNPFLFDLLLSYKKNNIYIHIYIYLYILPFSPSLPPYTFLSLSLSLSFNDVPYSSLLPPHVVVGNSCGTNTTSIAFSISSLYIYISQSCPFNLQHQLHHNISYWPTVMPAQHPHSHQHLLTKLLLNQSPG